MRKGWLTVAFCAGASILVAQQAPKDSSQYSAQDSQLAEENAAPAASYRHG